MTENLTQKLLKSVKNRIAINNSLIENAILKVPRHHFTHTGNSLSPGIEAAYMDEPIPIMYDEIFPESSASTPSLVARMLEILDPQPGENILEAGTASGYNTALLAEITEPGGSVTTLEYEKQVYERAISLLQNYRNVNVLNGDGALGATNFAPFNKIIVTFAATKISTSWLFQLKENGTALVPYMKNGVTYLVFFQKKGNSFHSRFVEPCWFMPAKGPLYDPAEIPMLKDDLQGTLKKCFRKILTEFSKDTQHKLKYFLFEEVFFNETANLQIDGHNMNEIPGKEYYFHCYSTEKPFYISYNLDEGYFYDEQTFLSFREMLQKTLSDRREPFVQKFSIEKDAKCIKFTKGKWQICL